MYLIQNIRNPQAYLAGISKDAIWTGRDFANKYLTYSLAQQDLWKVSQLGYQVKITEA